MSCERADQIDVDAFLAEPGAGSFDDFRAHYPTCDECAEAVADWSALDLGLRDLLSEQAGVVAAADDHPTVDRLERFLGAPSLAPEVAAHLDTCATCRIEVDAMRGFVAPDFAPAPEPVAEKTPGLGARLIGWLVGEGTPAVRLAAAAIVIVLAVGSWWTLGSNRGAAPSPRMAANETEPSPAREAIVPAVPVVPEEAEGPPTQLAEVAPSEESEAIPPIFPEASPVPDSADGAPPDEMLAEVTPDEASTSAPTPRIEPGPPSTADDEGETVVVLLAALDMQGIPVYQRPSRTGDVDWMQRIGTVRAGSTGPAIETRAPTDHTGYTLEASPRLWWSLEEASPLDVRLVVTTADAIDPLVEVTIPGPQPVGLGFVDLAAYDAELEPGVAYRWSVSLVVDARRRSNNPIAAGSIERLAPDSDVVERVDAAERAARGHALAREGVWYDAWDYFSRLARAHPDAEAPRRAQDELVGEAGR